MFNEPMNYFIGFKKMFCYNFIFSSMFPFERERKTKRGIEKYMNIKNEVLTNYRIE